MNRPKVYVGNLAYSVTQDQLTKIFSEAGTIVDAVVITDRATGRSKGFGFVEFESKEAAEKAIDLFNGKEIEGRQMVVNEARPQKQRRFSAGGFQPSFRKR